MDAPAATMGLSLSTDVAKLRSITSPLTAAYIPSKILIKPAPPESITPTSLRTGNNSGVRFKDSLAS